MSSSPALPPRPTGGRPAGERPTDAATAEPAPICERCGAQMYDRHCKIACPNCGYLRDCSDPVC